MKADLHLHTTASDGRLSPAELVFQAASLGLDVIALTDHDSVGGVAPALAAAREFPSLRVIPGIEISTDVSQGEVHILGYFIDPCNSGLTEALAKLHNSRQVRAQKMIAKLAQRGLSIDWGRVQELSRGGSVGRPHIAQAMLEQGYVLSLKEAFTKYIGRKRPAYVEREKITPSEAVELVIKSSGLPVLAHPAEINHLVELIPQLQKVGLAGIEVYYNGYTPQITKYLASLACKHGLVASGGSDYHGLSDSETPLGGVKVPSECVEQLFALAKEQCASLT